MINLIIDDYKLQLFLFEKMGSRSIEDAINDKVGNQDYINYEEYSDLEYSDPLGGVKVKGEIFDYRKYDGRIEESYLDINKRPYEEMWPKGYKRVLVFRNTYHRLVSVFYHQINTRGRDKEGWDYNTSKGVWDDQYKKIGVHPKTDNIEEHIECFHKFYEFHVLLDAKKWKDGIFYGRPGHMNALWEEIPEYLSIEIDELIELSDTNIKIPQILEEQNCDDDKINKFKNSLEVNRSYYKKIKSKMGDDKQIIRPTDDYMSYYNTMPKETMDSINNFYEWDLEFTGVKLL